MSPGDGLQSDVLWGQDSGASSNCLLLAATLVSGYSGLGTGGNSVHHHHLHPEIMKVWLSLLFSLDNICTCWTNLIVIDNYIEICTGSFFRGMLVERAWQICCQCLSREDSSCLSVLSLCLRKEKSSCWCLCSPNRNSIDHLIKTKQKKQVDMMENGLSLFEPEAK